MSSVLRNTKLEGDTYHLPKPDPSRIRRPRGSLVWTDQDLANARAEGERAGRERTCQELADGVARMERAATEAREVFQSTTETLLRTRETLLRDAAEEVIAFALEVARRIVRAEIETGSDSILPLVRELLHRVAAADKVVIRLAPRDHAILIEQLDGLPEASGHTGLRIRADSTLEPGDCLLETEQGNLDARVSTQFARLEEALRREDDDDGPRGLVAGGEPAPRGEDGA